MAARKMVESSVKQHQAQSQREQIEIPLHVSVLVDSIKSRFREASTDRPWDDDEQLLYTKQVFMLTRDQCRAVYYRLRELGEWRPSLPTVKSTVAEVTGIHTDPLPGNVAESRRVVKATGPVTDPARRIEGAAETPGYLRFRSMLRGKVESEGLKWKKRDTEK
jgi:hypothetical protein